MSHDENRDHGSRTTSRARTVLVVALVAAAVGTLGEYLTGVPGFPVVPPGPFILAGAAALVAFLRWRGAPAVGLLASAFVLVGAILSGVPPALLTVPSDTGPFVSAVVQLGGLVVAVVAGVAALLALRRR